MCLGIPGQVVAITDSEKQLAKVDVAGIQREVNLTCVMVADEPIERCVGRWVLVHVGFAMSTIDEVEARKTLALLRELGDIEEELAAMRAGKEEPEA